MSANVTVLKDELGLDREYREVKRKARVGERVKYIWLGCNSRIDVVTKVKDDGSVKIPAYVDENGDECVGYTLRAYVVLEKTDIVHVNDERFREVKRKANVGERVVITKSNSSSKPIGMTGVCTISDEFDDDSIDADLDNGRGVFIDRDKEDYRVLVPVQEIAHEPLTPVQQAQVSEQQAQIDGLTETVANLARRLSEVEAQLRVDHEDIVLIDEGVGEDIRKLTARVAKLERGQAPKEACEPVVSKTSTREEIIEKAKADVAELIRVGNVSTSDLPETSPLSNKFYRVTFEINRKKHAVVALVRLMYGNDIVAKGIAKCAPNDCFNVHIGMAIALHRALGLDIPQEYVNAAQPTESVVGDYVEYDGYIVKVEPSGRVYNYTRGGCAVGSCVARKGRIIDDSRDGRYGEVYGV